MTVSSIFEADEFKPYRRAWDARLEELSRRHGYYDGSVYKKVRGSFGWLWPRLYGSVKPLYLPLARAVDVDAGLIPARWSFPEDAPPEWVKARDQVWAWSEWSTRGVLYVHYGAVYGLAGLKVADIRAEARIVIDPVDPTTFMLIYGGQYDQTPDMALVVEKRKDAAGDDFEYAEAITPEVIRTFKDGVLQGFDDREPEYANELGFVPFVEVKHIETGNALGECTYQKAIAMLDEVNQLASYLAETISQNADPQWAISGAEPSNLQRGEDWVWYLPAGAQVQAFVPNLDIAGVLEFIREIAKNVEKALPESAFDELRGKDQIATATLELQLMELVLKIKRTRPNYDAGMVRALRMVGRAAASMSLPEVAVLDDEMLALDNERAVLPLDEQTLMSLEMQQLALERERDMARLGAEEMPVA